MRAATRATSASRSARIPAPRACGGGQHRGRGGVRGAGVEGRRRGVFDLQLDRLGDLRPGDLGGDGQGEVDPGGDARRR